MAICTGYEIGPYMIVFIIPILDAHHFRTKILTKANYHAVIKYSQNNISEA